MTWTQVYDPLGNLWLSVMVAALPIIVLLGLLAFFRVRAHIAAIAGLLTALLTAVFVYGMPPQLAFASAAYGAAFGLFPIGWIVLPAIFLYDITVYTGKFEILKQSVAGVADDRRIQALLIAFSFGAFIEGAAGFGTPVAISSAILIGLGFKPLQAAVLSLVGNTAPVAFGSLGIPIIALQKVTNLPLEDLSAMAGRQLPFFSLVVPFWLVWVMSGWRGMIEVWRACLAAGLSFAVLQFLVSNFHGPWLVDFVAAGGSILSLLILLKFWKPKTVWRFDYEKDEAEENQEEKPRLTPKQIFTAWMPWLVMTVVIFVWALPNTKEFFNSFAELRFSIPGLDKMIFRVPPVTLPPRAEEAVFVFNWLSATGTGLLISAVVAGLLLGLTPLKLLRIFGATVWRVRIPLLTISAMLALGFTTRLGGLDATLGLAFASTGFLFPFFSPLLGWLGVALTGSDTASNVLFGNLQQITAEQVGISPILAASANSVGGVMGKMIDAQSIVVASVATNQQGGEGEILRKVFWHSLILASLVGVVVFLQAYVFPSVIPN